MLSTILHFLHVSLYLIKSSSIYMYPPHVPHFITTLPCILRSNNQKATMLTQAFNSYMWAVFNFFFVNSSWWSTSHGSYLLTENFVAVLRRLTFEIIFSFVNLCSINTEHAVDFIITKAESLSIVKVSPVIELFIIDTCY